MPTREGMSGRQQHIQVRLTVRRMGWGPCRNPDPGSKKGAHKPTTRTPEPLGRADR